jgi:TorA maturation chaperone TorD
MKRSPGLATPVYRSLGAARPPWGSVWLDKENVLFGDYSGIAEDASERDCSRGQSQEPEDHFGTLLLLAAWLCESGQEEAFSQLLAWHLLPGPAGSSRCLSPGPDTPYQSLGQLAQATLAEWQRQLPIAVADKPLYR